MYCLFVYTVLGMCAFVYAHLYACVVLCTVTRYLYNHNLPICICEYHPTNFCKFFKWSYHKLKGLFLRVDIFSDSLFVLLSINLVVLSIDTEKLMILFVFSPKNSKSLHLQTFAKCFMIIQNPLWSTVKNNRNFKTN